MFVLMGATSLTSHFLAAMASLGLGVLLIPPLEKLVFSKMQRNFPTWLKVVAGIFLFGMMGANSPKTEVKVNEIQSNTPSLTATISSEQKQVSGEEIKKLYEVVKVVDGDTIQVNIEGKNEVIRLIGIDTSESVDPRKPVQCFANEASKKAKEILTIGTKVSLEDDPTQGDKDKYNRLLRYVFLEDGTNFAKLMILEGYGHEYTYQTPYKYMEEFKQAEKEAREGEKGLWAADACVTTPTPTMKANPTVTIRPTTQPTATQSSPTSSGFSCGSKTKCGEMTSCAEAMYYLNTCGVSRLDGDKDGVPCETLCN